MDSIIGVLIASFSPQITISLAGGFLGGLIGAEGRKREYGKRLTFLLLIASVVDAGAVADWLATEHQVKSLFILMAGGIAVGIFSGHLMDALRVASPRLARKLINKAGDVAVDKIDDFSHLMSNRKIEGGKDDNDN